MSPIPLPEHKLSYGQAETLSSYQLLHTAHSSIDYAPDGYAYLLANDHTSDMILGAVCLL